ncbi:MAG TPA: alkaline phosphatase family protein, partial [Terriglobales bacterium]
LPYYYELATQFATSDRMFSPLLSNTIPNRTLLFTGTTRGMVYQDQPSATDAFNQPTIFDKLQAAGVSWRYYYMDSSVFLASFPNSWGTTDNPNLPMQGNVRSIDELFKFLADPNADKLLPKVIFIERGSQTGLDEHPDNNIQPGAAKVSSIINALMQSKAWPTSVFFLTYDEAGGLYDHVPPMQTVAPDDIPVDHTPTKAGTQVNPGDFTESGMRLPFIAVSPFVKPHYVSHVPRDTTAILKFIETRFAVTPLTRRDAAQDDMTEMFDFANPAWLVPPASVLNTVQPTDGVAKQSLETAGSQ